MRPKNRRGLLVAAALLGSAACGVDGADVSDNSSTALLGTDSFLYFQCNATGWGVGSSTQLKKTSDPYLFSLTYQVKDDWIVAGTDTCVFVETNANNGWGSWQRRYGYSGSEPFTVPGGGSLMGTNTFTVKYPEKGTYRVLVDWRLGTFNIQKPEIRFMDSGQSLVTIKAGSSDWGDYDADGDLDLFVSGYISSQMSGPSSISYTMAHRLYRNDAGALVEAPLSGDHDVWRSSAGVYRGNIELGDYDNDGRADLYMGGNDGGSRMNAIFHNNGFNSFTRVYDHDTGFALQYSHGTWGDYDKDGDLDLIYAGQNRYEVNDTVLLRNDGNGFFVPIRGMFPALTNATMQWGDYDKDGDLDLFIAGSQDGLDSNGATVPIDKAYIFRNDGRGTFTSIGADLQGISRGAGAWGDYDGDGDLDLAVTGQIVTQNGAAFSAIYRNDAGQFVLAPIDLGDVFGVGDVLWADADIDGDLDLFIIDAHAGRWYENKGAGTFARSSATDVPGVQVVEGQGADADVADYDGDGDLDLLIVGGGPVKLYKNIGARL